MVKINIYNPKIEDLNKYLKNNVGTFHIKISSIILKDDNKRHIGDITEIEALSIRSIQKNDTLKINDVNGIIYNLDIIITNASKTNLMININVPQRIYILKYDIYKYDVRLSRTKINVNTFFLNAHEKRLTFNFDSTNAFENFNIFKAIDNKIDNLVRYVIKNDIKNAYKGIIEEIKNKYDYNNVRYEEKEMTNIYINKCYH